MGVPASLFARCHVGTTPIEHKNLRPNLIYTECVIKFVSITLFVLATVNNVHYMHNAAQRLRPMCVLIQTSGCEIRL